MVAQIRVLSENKLWLVVSELNHGIANPYIELLVKLMQISRSNINYFIYIKSIKILNYHNISFKRDSC